MNQPHIHLLITHLPIFGSILGSFVLGYGLWSKSEQTKIAAYYVLIISSVGACVAYYTGEGTEEIVEKIPGVLAATIKTHETFALYALISLMILGFASVVGLYLTFKQTLSTRATGLVILLLALISFGLVARTGYLGGQIRHTEITEGVKAPSTKYQKDIDD